MGKTKVICFANNKGGSGKSTTCANVGYGLTQLGKKVLLIDGDMQLNLSLSLFDEDKVLAFAQSDKNLYEGIRKQADLTDYIVQSDFENLDLIPSSTLMSSIEYELFRMWKEIFKGYDSSQKPKITTFDNNDDGIVYDNMIIDQGDFHSNCEHHCVWFWGKYWFAYIPNPKGKILGISKIGRVVDYCSARLQIQERLVHDIVDMLKAALGEEYPPLGIALVMKGHHSCKEFRGAKKKGIMTSSYLEGAFRDDPQVRAEFMSLVNGDKYEG